jgi:hypothetical protein
MAYDDTDKPRPKGLSDTELEAILSTQIALAKDHDKNEREHSRSKALDYFLGNMDKYVPPEPNRSKVVSRDVADTIGWMLPGIMRVFTASDQMAEAEPVGVEDIEFAREATDGLNHVFWKDNRGYEVVYAATWDSLLAGNGVVKTYYDDTPVYATSFHSGLSDEGLLLLLAKADKYGNVLSDPDDPEGGILLDEDVEVLAHTLSEDPDGLPEHEVKIKRKKADGRFIVEAIPPEDFLIDGDAITTEDAAFTAHWERTTRSALVAEGYDKDDVYAIPEAGRNETPEAAARRLQLQGDATDASMELVDKFECFVRIDVDGDGEAELIRACYAGGETGKLLDWEVWEDEHPFDDIPCEPIPHRWDARSIADETMDVQDVKTVLTRQLLNNTYWVNNPQRFATGKIKNPEELQSPTFGGVVMADIGAGVTDLVVPYIGDKALMGITYMDEVIQKRTGVGRQSMALDPEALQNQTAEANRNNKDAAYSQVELVARNMAEWGWSKVFRKLLKLMIKHQTTPRKLMIKGQEREIDPRHWNADMDVTINVGLGTGSRDRDLAMLGQVLQTQLLLADRFISTGATEDAIDMLPKILRTMIKMAESAGLRNPEDFYPEYTEEKVAKLKELAAAAAEKPDPKLQEIEAKAAADEKLKQVDAQVTLQTEQARLQAQQQSDAMASDVQVRREQAQLEADLQTKEADRQNALVLEQQRQQFEREKLNREFEFKVWDAEQTRQLEREKMAHAAQIAAMKPKPKPGRAAAK